MVKKSSCISDKFFAPPHRQFLDRKDFKQEVVDVCGSGLTALISAMRIANSAMTSLFDVVGSIGRCLYPAGSENRHSYKVACINSIMTKLKSSDSRLMGVLSSVLTLAVTYSGAADELLKTPRYGRMLENVFKIGSYEQTGPLAHAVSLAVESEGAREVACASLIANQQAFAETFAELKPTLEIWMRTYAREFRSCKKILNKLPDPEKAAGWGLKDQGFCKTEYKAAVSMSPIPCADATAAWNTK